MHIGSKPEILVTFTFFLVSGKFVAHMDVVVKYHLHPTVTVT